MASDEVVIVIEPDTFSVKNLHQMIEYIQQIQQKNVSLKVSGVLMNKVDLRRKITKNIYETVEKDFEDYLFNTYIKIDTSIPNSNKSHKTIRQLPWGSPNAKKFNELTREILVKSGI